MMPPRWPHHLSHPAGPVWQSRWRWQSWSSLPRPSETHWETKRRRWREPLKRWGSSRPTDTGCYSRDTTASTTILFTTTINVTVAAFLSAPSLRNECVVVIFPAVAVVIAATATTSCTTNVANKMSHFGRNMLFSCQNNYQRECGSDSSTKSAFKQEHHPESYAGEVQRLARSKVAFLSAF